MRLFGLGGSKQQPEDKATRQRHEASAQSLAQGGLPLNAIDRLREQAGRQNTPGHIFTGDLSVNELALVRQAGYEPLGQVMGSSVYHVGWQWMPNWSGNSGELDVLTQAYYHARHLAIGRLQQEAQLLGATGVVGVRLERKQYDWGVSLLEFSALGTAIREADVSPQDMAGSLPFVSDLSGQEFWLLRQSGFRPVGFALGNCSYYQVANWRSQNAMMSWSNSELADFTQALYNARSLAMGRMEHEARAVNAVGVVGADVDVEAEVHNANDNNSYPQMLYHFTATGTAIAPYTGRWPQFTVTNTVSLQDAP
jgi:uncharacterized protein YbjQ (UPF0145 family)